MLKKQERLGRKDIELFFREKSSFYKGKDLALKAKKRKDKKIMWAFAVSSEIKNNAVARNTTRRRMNEIAQILKGSIHGGYSLVFLVKLSTKQSPSFRVLKDDMIQVLKSCGALS